MNLDELKAICDAATPGPWKKSGKYFVRTVRPLFDDTHKLAETIEEQDTDFIATARTEMPKLIDRIQKLEAALKIARRNIHHGELRHELAGDDDFSAFVELCPACAALKEIDALLAEGKE